MSWTPYVGVDFDGTLIPFGPLHETIIIDAEVAKAVNKLAEKYKVVILTSRLSATWWEMAYRANGFTQADIFGQHQISYVRSLLEDAGIQYSVLTAEKIPCVRYFDDMAWHSTYESIADDIEDFLNGS